MTIWHKEIPTFTTSEVNFGKEAEWLDKANVCIGMFNAVLRPQSQTTFTTNITTDLYIKVRIFVVSSFVLEGASGEPDYQSLAEKITNTNQSFDEQHLNDQFIELYFNARHLLIAFDGLGLRSYQGYTRMFSNHPTQKIEFFVWHLRDIALKLFSERDWIDSEEHENANLSTIVNKAKETKDVIEVSKLFSLMFTMREDDTQMSLQGTSTSHQPKRARRW